MNFCKGPERQPRGSDITPQAGSNSPLPPSLETRAPPPSLAPLFTCSIIHGPCEQKGLTRQECEPQGCDEGTPYSATFWEGQPCHSLTSSSPADGISRSVTAPLPPPCSGSPASSYHLSYLIISSCLSCPPLRSPISFLHLFLSLTISIHLLSL